MRIHSTYQLAILLTMILALRVTRAQVVANDDHLLSTHDKILVNSALQSLFDADQRDRAVVAASKIDGALIARRDANRRSAVDTLLRAGFLRSGKDFEEASVIFQHGVSSNDYLLAHVLAMISLTRGDASSKWLAAATLDRYLASINQPQIFGTQFHYDEGNWSQQPYDKQLLTDVVRKVFDIPGIAGQQKQLSAYSKLPHPHTKSKAIR